MLQLLSDKATLYISQFDFVNNKRRREFVSLYLISLALSRSVQFHRAAEHLKHAQILIYPAPPLV
jgi:hypothetical protein